MRGIRTCKKPKQVLRTAALKSLSVLTGLYREKGQGLEEAHHLKEQGIENIGNFLWKVRSMFYTLSPNEGAIISITYWGEVSYLPVQIEGNRSWSIRCIFSILRLPHLAPLCHLSETSASLELRWCPMADSSFFFTFLMPTFFWSHSAVQQELMIPRKRRSLRSEALSSGALTKNGVQASVFFNVLQACWYTARAEN